MPWCRRPDHAESRPDRTCVGVPCGLGARWRHRRRGTGSPEISLPVGTESRRPIAARRRFASPPSVRLRSHLRMTGTTQHAKPSRVVRNDVVDRQVGWRAAPRTLRLLPAEPLAQLPPTMRIPLLSGGEPMDRAAAAICRGVRTARFGAGDHSSRGLIADRRDFERLRRGCAAEAPGWRAPIDELRPANSSGPARSPIPWYGHRRAAARGRPARHA